MFRLKCPDGQVGKSRCPDEEVALKEATRWTGIRGGSRREGGSDNSQKVMGRQESYIQFIQNGDRSFWCA